MSWITKLEDFDEDDIRHHLPRFVPGTWDKNIQLGVGAGGKG